MPARFHDPARDAWTRQIAEFTSAYGTRRGPGCKFPAGPCLSFPVRLPTVCRRTTCFTVSPPASTSPSPLNGSPCSPAPLFSLFAEQPRKTRCAHHTERCQQSSHALLELRETCVKALWRDGNTARTAPHRPRVSVFWHC